MRSIRPPTTEPAVNGRILDWARQAQQTFRDIAAAFNEISIPRPKAQTIATQSSALQSFQLVEASTESQKKIRVVYGTIAGEMPTGFSEGDEPPYVLDVSGAGFVYAGITIDTAGQVTARWVDQGADVPANTDTDYHVEIGSFSVTSDPETLALAQARYGPINVQVCRNWYATEPPFFSVLFF